MAKKRRKTRSRAHAQGGARPGTATAERPAGSTTGRPSSGSGPAGAQQPSSAPQRTRAEKKDLARQQREEIRKRVKRSQRLRQLAWVIGAAVVIGGAIYWFARPDEPAVRPDTLPGELTTTAPWDANAELAADRAEAIGLPGHGSNLAMHEHANVQIFVNGGPVAIPVDIGINRDSGDVASIHTHSGDGVVHIESSTVAEFTLGQFFDVWGVRFGDTCLGGYCEEGEEQVRVFVGGTEATGPIRDVPLDDQTVIVVTFGTDDELPDPIPSTFDFSTVQP